MRPTLIIDADDTLWDTEVYYEKSLEAFLGLMAGCGFGAQEVNCTVDAVQRERVPVVGYAPQEYARNLVIAYERLCAASGCPAEEAVAHTAHEIGSWVLDHPVDPLEGVRETLEWLRPRFRLMVLTKGDRATQESKLQRSGLRHQFEAVHVVREKNAGVLRDLLDQFELEPDQTWMVGNSPRSDINPAVQAGIGAIYIPHANTWDLEQAEIESPERVIELQAFRELAALFDGSEGRVQ